MKSRNIYASTLLQLPLMLAATSATANDPTNSVCNALLSNGISNTTTYTSEQKYLSVISDQYCGSQYDSLTTSKKSSFGIVVYSIPINLSGSSGKISERHTTFCRNYNGYVDNINGYKYDAKSLYDKAIDAWNDCLKLEIGGTSVKPTISNEKDIVDFELSSTLGSSVFTGVDTTNMTCRIDGKSVTEKESMILNSDKKSMRCSRSSKEISFNGSNVEYYPPADVKVKTNVGDYRIELYEKFSGAGADRLSRIEAQIASLNQSLQSLATGDVTSRIKLNSTGEQKLPKRGACPPGSVMTAFELTDITRAKYSSNSVKTITFDCTTLYSAMK